MATYNGQPLEKILKFNLKASYSSQTVVNYVIASSVNDKHIWQLQKMIVVAQDGTVNGLGILADYGADIDDPNNPPTNGVVGVVEKFGYGTIPSVPSNSAEVTINTTNFGYDLQSLGSGEITQKIYTLQDSNKGWNIHGNAKITIAIDIQDFNGTLSTDFIDIHTWWKRKEFVQFEEGITETP